MLILHIMASRALGGAETTSVDVMLSLHKAGIDQCVVMAANAPRFAELKAAGLRMAPEVLAWPLRTVQRFLLARLIRREKPDLIQCWMRRAAELMPRDGLGMPVIGWFGGYYDPARFKSCTHFVGVTQDIVRHMTRSGVKADRAFFIPTFPDVADSQAIDRATLATPPDAKVLLTLSRLHEKKGIDTFLEALAVLPECIGWIAGDGPLRHKLEKLAAKLGVMERVRFLGWRTDRAALLRPADICVLPSRYEPFGTVILEAWTAGVPLIASATAGPAAHVKDGINGLLTPIDDAPALAEAIRRTLNDADLRQRMIAGGRAAYEKDYTRAAVTQKWLTLYRELTAGAA